MNLRLLAAVPLAFLPLLPAPANSPAKPAAPLVTLRYRWAAGQTLTYLVQQDPYFADPNPALSAEPDAAYAAPVVTRLTEKVDSLGRDGAAALTVTQAFAPGFEPDEPPQEMPGEWKANVTAQGKVSGFNDPEQMRRAFPWLPAGPVRVGASWAGPDGSRMTLTALRGGPGGLAILTQTYPAAASERRTPDHDGTLLAATRITQTGRIVFDLGRGQVARQVQTRTAAATLVMTGRGRRGVADFGRVVPSVQTVQTLTMERQTTAP